MAAKLFILQGGAEPLSSVPVWAEPSQLLIGMWLFALGRKGTIPRKATRPKSKPPKLNFEQIETLANISDCAVDYPKLPFEQVTKKARRGFLQIPKWKIWEKEQREVFEREIAGSSPDRRG